MALNVFGPLTKDDIKVSYIDPSLGLVSDVSIAQMMTEALVTFLNMRKKVDRPYINFFYHFID